MSEWEGRPRKPTKKPPQRVASSSSHRASGCDKAPFVVADVGSYRICKTWREFTVCGVPACPSKVPNTLYERNLEEIERIVASYPTPTLWAAWGETVAETVSPPGP